MSISPPSDIVLDVAQAADPLRYQEAVGRLKQMAYTAQPGAFEEVFEDVAGDPAETPKALQPIVQLPFDSAGALTRLRSDSALRQPAAAEGDPLRSFEAMALAGFVESMLPSGSATLFGAGTAGDIWRSMLAEQIAAQMAEAGGIGIADQLRAAGPAADQAQASAATDDRSIEG
jgi:hypothetical protein